MRHIATFALLLAVAGCSGDDDDDSAGPEAGGCPSMEGDWTITQHCETSFVGQTMQVSQTECSYSASGGGFDCPGTITTTGSVSQTCEVGGGQTIHCVGQLTSDTLTLDCDEDCHVEAQRS